MVTQTFGYGLVRISPRGVRCVRLLRGSPLLTRRLELRAGRATAPSGVGGASVSQLGLDSAHTAPRRKASGVPWRVLSSATARCAAGPEPYFIRTENGVSLGRLRKQSALCSSVYYARAVSRLRVTLSEFAPLQASCLRVWNARKSRPHPKAGALTTSEPLGSEGRRATWLILPVVICLSQRLSHACLSISDLYCETANGSLNQLWFI